jgi:hypothetical protein
MDERQHGAKTVKQRRMMFVPVTPIIQLLLLQFLCALYAVTTADCRTICIKQPS